MLSHDDVHQLAPAEDAIWRFPTNYSVNSDILGPGRRRNWTATRSRA